MRKLLVATITLTAIGVAVKVVRNIDSKIKETTYRAYVLENDINALKSNFKSSQSKITQI